MFREEQCGQLSQERYSAGCVCIFLIRLYYLLVAQKVGPYFLGHKGTFDADITLATVAFSRAATSRLNVTTFHDPGTTEATYFVDDAASPHVISTPRSHAVTHPSCDKFLGLSFGVLLLQILDAHCAHE